MNHKIIGRMILADVLEMGIDRYLDYVDRFLAVTSDAPFYRTCPIDEHILKERPEGADGAVVREGDGFRFYAPKQLKLDFELLGEPEDVKWKHSMNWIRTKNLFLHHVMANVLSMQRGFWESRDRKDMVPISLKGFLKEHPFLYMDISRLSRLANNTTISYNDTNHPLRDLFPSPRKVHIAILEHVIHQQGRRMKDREIQAVLRKDYGIDLSRRTVCGYRNSLQIPAHNKEHSSSPYSSLFSGPLSLHMQSLCRVPERAGVYEISIAKYIKYPKFVSRVIYLGRSGNLRSRVQNYLYANIKNPVIERYRECQGLFIRYFTTSNHIQVEKELLQQFSDRFGLPPVANRLPWNKAIAAQKRGVVM